MTETNSNFPNCYRNRSKYLRLSIYDIGHDTCNKFIDISKLWSRFLCWCLQFLTQKKVFLFQIQTWQTDSDFCVFASLRRLLRLLCFICIQIYFNVCVFYFWRLKWNLLFLFVNAKIFFVKPQVIPNSQVPTFRADTDVFFLL